MDLSDRIPGLLLQLPECALICVNEICGQNATEACICPNKRDHAPPWSGPLNTCLITNCTQPNYLAVGGLTYQTCGLVQWDYCMEPLLAVTLIFEIVFFSVRIWAVWTRNYRRGWDDITISIAFALLMCFIPILVLEEDYGLYTNVYDLDLRNLDRTTITFFVYEILYCLALGMTKISIAFMYFRILEGRWWSRVLWATQAFNVLAILSVLIGLLLSCKPLDVYWASSWDAGGNCPDLWLWNGYSLGLNLFLDVWLIAIPSTYVWKTNLARRSKFAVTGMFCLGLVTMAMTIMRFVALEEAASTITGDDLMAGLIWSTLEVVTAFLCACVPAMRLFIQHFFPVMKKGLSTFATSTVVTVTGSSRRASTKVGYGWRGISSNYPAAPANTTATVAGDEEIGGGGGGDAGAGRRLARSFGLSSKGAGLDGTMGEENGRDGGESRSGSVVHFGLASADTHEMIQVPGKAKSASAARYVV